MSLTIVRAAQEIENCDDFHVARILLLLQASAGRSDKPVKGIMKLAKLDFLVRYPSGLVRVLEKLKRQKQADEIRTQEGETIEAKMIRFRFGPWDERYRRWIGIMSAKGLANTFVEGRTVNVKLTELGVSVAIDLVKAQSSKQSPSAQSLWHLAWATYQHLLDGWRWARFRDGV